MARAMKPSVMDTIFMGARFCGENGLRAYGATWYVVDAFTLTGNEHHRGKLVLREVRDNGREWLHWSYKFSERLSDGL